MSPAPALFFLHGEQVSSVLAEVRWLSKAIESGIKPEDAVEQFSLACEARSSVILSRMEELASVTVIFPETVGGGEH